MTRRRDGRYGKEYHIALSKEFPEGFWVGCRVPVNRKAVIFLQVSLALLEVRDRRFAYLPSGFPMPGITLPPCGLFLPDIVAATIFAPNTAESLAASLPICTSDVHDRQPSKYTDDSKWLTFP